MRGRTIVVTGCAALLRVGCRNHRRRGPTRRSARRGPALAGGFKHLVVIYEENHSFDNLYGTWGSVNGQQVVGLPTPTNPTPPRSPRTATRTAVCCRTTST